MMLSPIEVITTPVTSGGNKGIKRPISGANNVVIKPAAIVAPNIPSRPISGFIPMAIIGVTAAKVTDIITGRRIPIKRPIPIHCNNVTIPQRSEEHTSELQSRFDLVCRLLLEKKKKKNHEKSHQSSLHNP